jgi:hypothetical protein
MLASQSPVNGLGRLVVGATDNVAVGAQSNCGVGVAQSPADVRDGYPALEKPTCVPMTKPVRRNRRQAKVLTGATEILLHSMSP